MRKKPEEFALEYAGFRVRLGAALIDLACLALIFYSTYCTLAGLSLNTGLAVLSPLIVGAVFLAIYIAYLIGFWVWRGQTPGKILLGIKIIRTDSSPLDRRHAARRFLGYIISSVVFFIGFICIAFDEHKQGWHDKIADTYVVKVTVRQVAFKESFAGGEIG